MYVESLELPNNTETILELLKWSRWLVYSHKLMTDYYKYIYI